ncbi:MAG: hypothetical protein JKX91_15670 [Rhizobiaceae bacterium]|nr:hypothetical protein [Rhizobiaceae bacterium]
MKLNKLIFTALAAGLITIGSAGNLVAETAGHTHKHSTNSKMAHDHSKLLSLEAGPNAPTIAIDLAKDAVGGWNLHIVTTHFRFAPEAVNAEHQVGEGHAHIYVNGIKLARVYGPWFHIGALPKGNVEVSVTLNANNHQALAVGDKTLVAVKNIVVE